MAIPEGTPSQPRDTTPRDEDEVMMETRNPDGTDGQQPGQAAKRARVSADGESTVSKLVPPSRETSPLRKAPPQSAWAHGFTPLAPMPAEARAWIDEYADKRPFNPAYDEAIYAQIPAGRSANPHLWSTERGPRPEFPLDGHEAFTPGPFPYTHINFWRHFGNLQPAQKEMLEKNLGNWIAIIPHGGGRAVNEHAQELCAVIEEFIWSLRFAGYNGESVKVTVIAADPRSVAGPNGTNDFAPPWPVFVDLSRDEKGILRPFLLYQQHFAISKGCCFSAHPVDPLHPRSWKTVLLVCPQIAPSSASHQDVIAARTAIREVLIDKLAANENYRALIAQLAAIHIGHTGNRDQIFRTVTDTYHLELTTVDSSEGSPTSAFVLLARPIVDSREDLEALKHAIIVALCGHKSPRDDDHFYVGTKKIRVVNDAGPRAPFSVDCKLCKSELHRTPDCPLPKSRGWRGVQPSDLGFPEEERPKVVAPRVLLEGVFDRLRGGTRGTGRGRGRGSEKRGRGRGGQNSGKQTSRK